MFKNIGKKIQSYASLVFAVEVFLVVVLAAALLSTLMSVSQGEGSVIAVGLGALVIAAGLFLAWLGQMRLYAYGKIAESCETMMKTLERMEAMQRAQIPVRRCVSCGAELEGDAAFCPECGTKQ